MPPRCRSTLVLVALGAGLVAVAPVGPADGAQEPPAGAPTTTVPLATTPSTSPAPTTSVAAATSDRQWLVPVPAGCEVPALPDVVFVGTLLERGTPAGAPESAEYETGRFQVDQVRAGAVERYSAGGIIDVRYGIDTKYLDEGERYIVGASVDPADGVLVSKVQTMEPLFGGDEVIGAAESDVSCPVIEDPVQTLDPDGTPVDAGVLSPLLGARRSILRSMLVPMTIAIGVIFGLVLLRWLITGVVRGTGSVIRTAAVPREVRAATRTRPNARPD